MSRLSLCVLLGLSVGCRMPGLSSGAVSFDEIVRALQDGRLKFEVRGLHNEQADGSAGTGTSSFTHKAVVVASGSPEFVKLPYVVVFRVKRIGGGDPKYPRSLDTVSVEIREGIGQVEVNGGFRTSVEAWQPEKIELTASSVWPLIPYQGASAKED